MAYAAVISLKHTIHFSLVNSRCILFVSSTVVLLLESAYNHTKSLQQVVEKFNHNSHNSSSKRFEALEGQIRDCAHKLEDFLQLHELNSEEEAIIRQEINSFIDTAKKLEKDYIAELSNPVIEEEDLEATMNVWTNIDSEVMTLRSHANAFTDMKKAVLKRMRPHDLYFLSLFGKVGCAKTVVARKLFEDFGIDARRDCFDCCAYVTVGTSHNLNEVLMSIIAQVGDEDEDLFKMLKHRRYMIVLDDVREAEVVEYLQRALPDQSNGSIVLFTTTSLQVAQLGDDSMSFQWTGANFQQMMWHVIRIMFFPCASMSTEFEEAAEEIIDNCGGVDVAAAKTLLFLLKTDKRVDQWRKIAADKEHPIFMVEDEISEVSKIKTELQTYTNDLINMDYVTRSNVEWIKNFVEFSDHLDDLNMYIYPQRLFPKMKTFSVWGMAGIGKTTFVRRIYKDEAICRHFEHLVWVTLGPKYQTGEILIDILAQIYLDIGKSHMKGDEKLVRDLCAQLSSKRCLIVLDDIWSKDPMHHLKTLFPEIKGVVVVTTRLKKLAKFGEYDDELKMELLDEEESWLLLRQKVFGVNLCPSELEKAGRKIAQKCDGLPLLIVTVADHLLRVDISHGNWNNVASGKEKSVFMNAHSQISKTLLPSYLNLPQHLKACFLYMGVFCEQDKISTSKLTNLLIPEGFLETNRPQMMEDFIAELLGELVDRTLLMDYCEVSDYQIKRCRLHSVFWHLSNSQAVKSKFFHAINSYDDCLIGNMQSQRRLCIRNNVLLGMKDVQNAMASFTSVANVRSLLCVGPFQQYPVTVCFDMRLLRVMNALSIRLYEFPVEVVALVHLRYLGLTCNGSIPTTVSNLWKLQYLIVKRYMVIKSSKSSWPLPMEIWDTKELKHLQVMGGHLPDHECGAGLLNLSALLDMSAENCREEVLKWIPNLKKLGIRIELWPNDIGSSFNHLDYIGRILGLEALKCVVVNPQFRSEVVLFHPPVSMFPSRLKKLSLSGLGYGWEEMSVIGDLQNLQVLKLKSYAFEGAKWDMDLGSGFKKLEYLLLEDTNLVHWKVKSPLGTGLKRVSIRHCYKLKHLPIVSQFYPLEKIEIVDCNPSVVTWAMQTAQALKHCTVNIYLSWIADK